MTSPSSTAGKASHAQSSASLDSSLRLLKALPQLLLIAHRDGRFLFHSDSVNALLSSKRIVVEEGRLKQIGQLRQPRLAELLTQAGTERAIHVALWFTDPLMTGVLHLAPLPTELSHAEWPVDATLLSVDINQPTLTQAARIDALTYESRLSQSERHVLMLLSDGMGVTEAARFLGLQVSTLRSHVRNLLGKTQAASLNQLLTWVGSAENLPFKKLEKPAEQVGRPASSDAHITDSATTDRARAVRSALELFESIPMPKLLVNLGLPVRTFERLEAGDPVKFSATAFATVLAAERILGMSTRVLGSKAAAEAWLVSPALALQGRTPFELLAEPGEVRVLEDLLVRLDYGVYA